MLNLFTVNPSVRPEEVQLSLDEIAREGARRMLIAALSAEAGEYVAKFRDLLEENGHRLVVRNGKAEPRKITLGTGTVEVQAPRVRDRRPGEHFTSKILPPLSGIPSASLQM